MSIECTVTRNSRSFDSAGVNIRFATNSTLKKVDALIRSVVDLSSNKQGGRTWPKTMEYFLKLLSDSSRKVWDERSLILLHRSLFVAFALIVALVTAAVVGGGEYAWFSSAIAGRDNEIRIKNATIENLQNRPRAESQQQHNPNRWDPLSDDETLNLRAELKRLAPEKLDVLCAFSGCTDLAQSIFSVLQDLQWTGNFEGWYLTDHGIKQGIEIWSYVEKKDVIERIADSIERATKGRLKVSLNEWPGVPTGDQAANISLVVGRTK